MLIYAHDGRGLGHASRSVAIGLALRRLSPGARVLLVTGCGETAELIEHAPLDWIKLPSYASRVVGGRAYRGSVDSKMDPAWLKATRERMLAAWIEELRPRCILVDHVANGKYGELGAAQMSSAGRDSRWFLGVRARPGRVRAFWARSAREAVRSLFAEVLWYGDSSVGAGGEVDHLRAHFGIRTFETGYVSRAYELAHAGLVPRPPLRRRGGDVVAAVLWENDRTNHFLKCIGRLARRAPAFVDRWRLFIGRRVLRGPCSALVAELRTLPHVHVEACGSQYLPALCGARVVVAYAGYNSIADAMWSGVPSVLLTRNTKDQEQLLHVQDIEASVRPLIHSIDERLVSPRILGTAIRRQASTGLQRTCPVATHGSTRAAERILAHIQCRHARASPAPIVASDGGGG